MRKLSLLFMALVACVLASKAQEISYNILHEADTTVKAKISGMSFGSRNVRYYVYEYPSKNGFGKVITASGIIMAPMNIVDGSVPCDGVIMFNHHTIGSPEDAPSAGGLDVPSGILANPLKPNYIVVMADYMGYGSSSSEMVEYLCGDTNARNSLDGLLAARKLFEDKKIPQGKYLFNMGYSQGGVESMYAAKLCDMEERYKGIRFTKTFVGGGPLDMEAAYSAYVKKDQCDAINDVAIFLISVNEKCHLGIKYSDLFKGKLGQDENVLRFLREKRKSVLGELGVSDLDSLHQLLQPAYMDLKSEPAQALLNALKEIKVSNGWTPDSTQQYYIEHSRHDNYVPVKCSHDMITWMKAKGFKASLVPGKTNLQTNMLVFKLKHQQAGIVWAIQTLAATQFWPVVYHENEQNRYYHNFVKDLNLMKVVKLLESWGLDLRKLASQAPSIQAEMAAAIAEGSMDPEGSVRQLVGSRRANILEQILGVLAKLDLTLTDAIEMLDDSGITTDDIMELVNYFSGSTAAPANVDLLTTLEDKTEAPLYLLRLYEQTLANCFLLAGHDVDYSSWGW